MLAALQPALTAARYAQGRAMGWADEAIGAVSTLVQCVLIGYTCIATTPREEAMLAIRLPENIETRLGLLAQETGLTKTALVREAILEHIDDLEDYFLAEARARKNRNTISLEDVERDLGLEN
jgi:RHH-type rel operon transcriptional repressor/antitoxin RelB